MGWSHRRPLPPTRFTGSPAAATLGGVSSRSIPAGRGEDGRSIWPPRSAPKVPVPPGCARGARYRDAIKTGTASSKPRRYLGCTACRACRRFVVQPLADFLADLPPVLRRRFHRLRVNDFFTTGRCSGSQRLEERGGDGTVERRGASAATGSGLFPRVESLQEQEQLRRIELLALGPKEPPHQHINLLAQQRVFLFQDRKPVE